MMQKRIALCMNLDDYYEHGIARGVVRYAKQQPEWRLYGYGWMFRPVEDLEYWKGDGIIARVESQADARRMASLKLPVVDVAGAYTWAGFHQVNNDDYATGVKAGNYLRSCGFSRFAYCGVADTGWSAERRAGFHAAVEEISGDIEAFEESLPWWEESDDSSSLEEWLKKLDRPVGVFACNDTAGVKLTELCRRLGIHVPEEAAIVGVDNEDILCELSLPSLSSIELDCGAIGFTAANTLDSLLDDSASPPISPKLIAPLDLIERESTKVFASDDPLVKQAVQYIRANATSGINVSEVIGQVAASRRSLEIRFREHMGRSLHDEIIRVRLEHAKILLRTTNNTVAKVAADSGFGTLQRFHTLFKEWTGSSPGKYRSAARNNGELL